MSAVREIWYRTKVRRLSDGTEYFEPKRKLSRTDCTLRADQHSLYNFDGFPSVLDRFHKTTFNGRSLVRLSELPLNVTIEPGFLATVRIALPETFK